jgi:hypothetical protein
MNDTLIRIKMSIPTRRLLQEISRAARKPIYPRYKQIVGNGLIKQVHKNNATATANILYLNRHSFHDYFGNHSNALKISILKT